MPKALFCFVDSEFNAEAIVTELRLAGIPDEAISVLYAEKIRMSAYDQNSGSRAPEGPMAGAAAPAATGGGLGWLAGVGTIAISGAGPVIAAGPILSTLEAAKTSGTSHGVADSLTAIGMPGVAASVSAAAIRNGDIFIGVPVPDPDAATQVRKIFEVARVRQILTSEESVLPKLGSAPNNYASRPTG